MYLCYKHCSKYLPCGVRDVYSESKFRMSLIDEQGGLNGGWIQPFSKSSQLIVLKNSWLFKCSNPSGPYPSVGKKQKNWYTEKNFKR